MSRPYLIVLVVLMASAVPALAVEPALPSLAAPDVPTDADEAPDDPREPVREAAASVTESQEGRALYVVEGLLGALLGLEAWDLLFGPRSSAGPMVATPVGPVPVEDALPLGLAGVAALGLLTLLGWWARKMGWLSGLPLFTRIQKDDLLKHEVRAQVFDYIRANPGTNITELSRDLGLAWGTVTHHLEKLRNGRLVSMRRMNNQKCWFENGGAVQQAEMVALSALKRGTAARIAAYLVTNPGVSQKEMAAALGLSRAAASFHVRKLAGHGLVERERAGKEMRLTLRPEAARSMELHDTPAGTGAMAAALP